MKVLVTGGAGYIGSNLAESLAALGHDVHIIDNFSSGRREFLRSFPGEVHEMDLLDESVDLAAKFRGVDTVYHLAANADVRFGWQDTRRDLRQNLLATLRVAEAAAQSDVSDLVFASTGSVYGEATQIPTPETLPIPQQTSLYGASKASAEAYLGAYAANKLFRVTVLRFVSVLGPRYTHGHVIDFVRQLVQDPSRLTVLGNGSQRKSYMHIDDCVRGLLTLRAPQESGGFDVFNLGVNDYCTVVDSIQWITARMALTPEVRFGTEDRGWVGDNPFIFLDVSKAADAGWVTQRSIRSSVEATVDWILANEWVLSLVDSRAS